MVEEPDFEALRKRQQEKYARESLPKIREAFERALHASDDMNNAFLHARQHAYRKLKMMCSVDASGATFSARGSAFGVRMSQDEHNNFIFDVVSLGPTSR